jgi:uncharacterized protein (TIGR02996 family)
MDQEEAFIGDILAAPGDDAPRLAYAAWLSPRDDPRGRYLRAEMLWARARDARLEAPLRQQGAQLDPVWVARVSRPPLGACAENFRLRPFSNPRQPKLSVADLDALERRFQLTLPVDYRAFLLNYNGGWAEPAHYRIPGQHYGDGQYECVVVMYSLYTGEKSDVDSDVNLVWSLLNYERLRASDEVWRAEPRRDLMIIGVGPPSGDLELLCLGCSGQALGQVSLVSVSWGGVSDKDYCLLAPSFAAFLAMLTDYDPDHVKAIKNGDVAALRRWLDAGGDPNECYRAQPLLSYGQMHVRPDCVRELLVRGAELWGGLLMNASHSGSQELVDLLRSHWVLGDHKPDHGNTPEVGRVVQAIKTGDVAFLRRWLDAGGQPQQIYQQMSLLTHAVVHANIDAARELLARGAKVWHGLVPYARSTGSQELIDLLQAHRDSQEPRYPIPPV